MTSDYFEIPNIWTIQASSLIIGTETQTPLTLKVNQIIRNYLISSKELGAWDSSTMEKYFFTDIMGRCESYVDFIALLVTISYML